MGQLSDRDFLAMNKQCEGELEKAQRELAELEGQRDSASDFKKHNGYLRSLQLSEQYGLYRQDYCGCEFSAKARGIEG